MTRGDFALELSRSVGEVEGAVGTIQRTEDSSRCSSRLGVSGKSREGCCDAVERSRLSRALCGADEGEVSARNTIYYAYIMYV